MEMCIRDRISTLVKKEGVPDGKKDKAGGSAGASVPGGKKMCIRDSPENHARSQKPDERRTGLSDE